MQLIYAAASTLLCPLTALGGVVSYSFTGDVMRVEPGHESLATIGDDVFGTLTYDRDTPHYYQQVTTYGYDSVDGPFAGEPSTYPTGYSVYNPNSIVLEAFPGAIEVSIGPKIVVNEPVALLLLATVHRTAEGSFLLPVRNTAGKLSVLSESQFENMLGVNSLDEQQQSANSLWFQLILPDVELSDISLSSSAATGPIIALKDLPIPSHYSNPLAGYLGIEPIRGLGYQASVVEFSVTSFAGIPEPDCLCVLSIAQLVSMLRRPRRHL